MYAGIIIFSLQINYEYEQRQYGKKGIWNYFFGFRYVLPAHSIFCVSADANAF